MTRRDESSFISPKMHLPPPHPEEACKRSWASLKNRSFQKIDPGEPNGPDTKEVVSVSIPLHSSVYWPLIVLFWPQDTLVCGCPQKYSCCLRFRWLQCYVSQYELSEFILVSSIACLVTRSQPGTSWWVREEATPLSVLVDCPCTIYWKDYL